MSVELSPAILKNHEEEVDNMQAANWEHEIKPLLTAFGKFIKSKRNELGLSQEELATRSGLHRTYISDVERGIRNLTLGAAWFLARGLSMELKDMLSAVQIAPIDENKKINPAMVPTPMLADSSAAR